MRKAVFVFFLVTLPFVPAVEAKTRDKAWELGLFGGNMDGDNKAGLKNGVEYGLLAGYDFSSKLAAEIRLSQTNCDYVKGSGDSVVRALVQVTGTFFADRETHTLPFISAGIGVIQETRDAFNRANGNRVLESFDSSALLSLAAGARTFFNDNWALRYEARYNHHDSFDTGQDEYAVDVGISWLVGGKK